MALKVGITGGIGSGKTYVCRRLERMGYDVFYCDEEARRLMEVNDVLRREIAALIGDTAYDAAGRLNKPVVSAFIRWSTKQAEVLNGIVHPHVRKAFREWCREREAQKCIFMECALMYEAHFDEEVDSIVYVYSPLELRLRRLCHHRGISEEQAREWMRQQMAEEEKASRANIIIYNGDGEPDVEKMLEELRNE